MKLLLVIVLFFATGSAWANSYGDHHCNIFVTDAENVQTGAYGNFYEVHVAVSKSILASEYQQPRIYIQYVRYGSFAEEQVQIPPVEKGNYMIYEFRLLFGATYWQDQLDLIPFVTNGIDRLYDNNFSSASGMVLLTGQSKWNYRNSNCTVQ